MPAHHLVFLVEDASTEALLRGLLTRLLPEGCTFEVHPFQGKPDLLRKLQDRLSGYSSWLPEDWRVIVVIDRDDDDCRSLKGRLEAIAARAGLRTRAVADGRCWQLANRIAIEELEAWYFGDWQAVRNVYTRVPQSIPNRARFRDPDAVSGGTWEAFEKILNTSRYFTTGLRKVEAARAIGAELDPDRSRSRSFRCFCEAVAEATG